MGSDGGIIVLRDEGFVQEDEEAPDTDPVKKLLWQPLLLHFYLLILFPVIISLLYLISVLDLWMAPRNIIAFRRGEE